MTSTPPKAHEPEDAARILQRQADRVASMIVTSCYSDRECALAERRLREVCRRLCPDRMDLYEWIYTARFRRLREQFRW